MHLAEYLRTTGTDQSALAARIGVSQAAISRYVRGDRIPRPAVMRKIIEATCGAVSPADFFDPADIATPQTQSSEAA